MKLSPVVLTTGIVLLGTLRAGAAPLIVNGDFSQGLAGWNASGDVVVTSAELSSDEAFGAILNAGDTTPNAVLSQTVATTIGSTYQLQFEYNSFQGNWYTPYQSLDVSAQSPGELLGNVVVGPPSQYSPIGTVFTLDFTAGATSSIITFSDNANNFTYSEDGALSNVSLTDLSPATPTVPDHGSTMLLLGLGLAALAASAGFGRRSLA